MNKNLVAMLEGINTMKAEVRTLYEAGKDDEAQAKMTALEKEQAKFENLAKLDDGEAEKAKSPENKTPLKTTASDPVHVFAEAARMRFKNAAGVQTEGTPADGGYTVPEDIQTRINQYRDATYALRQLVRVENVMTMTGARTFQSKASAAAFAAVAENGAVSAGDKITFSRVAYTIQKYGGYFAVSNELLADSDANITDVITRWIGDAARATDNSLILARLQAATPTAITSVDAIKTAINVTLGQAYRPYLKIVTNDTGLNMLDTLKDKQDRYLLTPDLSTPGQMRLACGASFFPVVVVPNSILANVSSSAPFFIGDFESAVTLFDRQQTSIKVSDTASIGEYNAFSMDETLFRATLRETAVSVDAAAWTYLTAASLSIATA